MMSFSPSSGSQAELNALAALAEREHRAGRLAEAAAAYRQILAIRPDLAETHNNLGLVLWRQGECGQAVASFLRALALRPDLADAHNNLGNASLAEGKFDDAAARYRRVVALRPDHAEAYNNLGMVLASQGRLDEAMTHFEQAVALKPDLAVPYKNLGNALRQQERFEEAAARYEQALSIDPRCAEAHYNLGVSLWHQDKLDEAAKRYRQALAIRPNYGAALNRLGCLLRQQLRITEARQAFERLRQLDPNSRQAAMGLGICDLIEGNYERGWPAYEARRPEPRPDSLSGAPRWTGQSLAARTLLLLPGAGLGDTIQFFRYARVAKARGARVVLAAQPALGRLLASHPDLDELVMPGSAEQWPRCDYYLYLMSAPGAFATTVATIPSQVPYIWADPELTERWRQELAPIAGLKVGIVWQGSREYALDRWRSIPLACFAPLARIPGVQLISLQKGFGTEQIAAVNFPVLDLSERLDETAGPFMDTAAVIRNLDLVVTADTAIAHLAGAMGAPVFLALHFSGDWRWLRDREDSPWYPTIRLFRQTKFGQWSDVFERIAQAIGERAASQDNTR